MAEERLPSAHVLGILLSGASIVCALWMILVFKQRPQFRQPHLLPILFMMLCDLVWAGWAILSYALFLLDAGDDSALCSSMGLIGGQFSRLSSFGWYFVLCLNTYMVLSGSSLARLGWSRHMLLQHVWVWGSAFVCTVVPGVLGAFGQDEDECWILESKASLRWFYYVPLLFYMGFALFIFIVIACSSTLKETRQQRRVIFRAGLFFLVFILVWSVPVVSRFNKTAKAKPLPVWFEYLHVVLRGCSGLANFMVWCSSLMFRTETFSVCVNPCSQERASLLSRTDQVQSTTQRNGFAQFGHGGSSRFATGRVVTGDARSERLNSESLRMPPPGMDTKPAFTLAGSYLTDEEDLSR